MTSSESRPISQWHTASAWHSELPDSLRALADLFADGVVSATADGNVTLCNTAAAHLLGVRVDDAIGGRLADVVHLLDHEGRSWIDVNRPFAAISIQRGIPEQSWVAPGGGEVLTTARLVRGRPLGAIEAIFIGLRSGRGRARLDQERSDLVATVAHELRSPLTGVKGFVGALLNRWDLLNDEQRKLMLTTAYTDADRLARLIAELLDVARIDTGRLQLYPRPVSAAALVTRVVESVRAGTSRPIEFDPPGDLPDLHADPDKFTQVATNLIQNAVLHGSGTVRVTMVARDRSIRLVVQDEGEGIPLELRQRVFTKFWTSGVSGGSGLGLYIVAGLTRAHGGEVQIEDARGGGARIVVDWPTTESA